VFWSKIWFFVVAVVAAVALTIALLMPRPAARSHAAAEHERLVVACSVVNVVLAQNARTRVTLASTFARDDQLVARIEDANGASEIDAERAKLAREVAARMIERVEGQRPDFAIIIDRRGRVVTRVKVGEDDFGDVVAGRPLIDDALAGYIRDDLWVLDNRLYLVAAAPVMRGDYLGAVVLGHAVTNEVAQKLTDKLKIGMAFYVNGDPVASTSATPLDRDKLAASYGMIKGGEIPNDCAANQPFDLRAGKDDLVGMIARLPGEAQRAQAYYAIFIQRPVASGFTATLGQVNKSDLGFGNFPWILVAGGFAIALVLGLGFMIIEHDRPLRRLNAEAVRLAKGEIDRLSEDGHRGKLGSIARSINIHIDKVGRDAKAAKKDLDQLLGPVPEGSLGAIDILGTMPSRPGGPAAPPKPPPSEFRFGDSSPKLAPTAPPLDLGPAPGSGPAAGGFGLGGPPPGPPAFAPTRTATPPRGAPAAPPPPRPPGLPPRTPVRAIEDDPLSRDINADPTGMLNIGSAPVGAPPIGSPGPENPYFREVFDQFLALKRTCNEPTAGLTYGKFADKLQRNRDELMQKTGCRDVRFTVYVKDGKAALKATPVRDE
jgi:hypothetical protein